MSKSPLFCIHRNQLVRQCLSATLASHVGDPQFQAIPIDWSETANSLQQVGGRHPLALVDLALPGRNAANITQLVVDRGGRVLILTPPIESESQELATLVACIEAGAQGYVPEDATVEYLVDAIDRVRQGKFYCSAEIARSVMFELVELSRAGTWESRLSSRSLTERELQILHWIAEGMSNKQVAHQLSLSVYTVKNHVHRILNKLNASDRTHAVRHAMEENWLPLPKAVSSR